MIEAFSPSGALEFRRLQGYIFRCIRQKFHALPSGAPCTFFFGMYETPGDKNIEITEIDFHPGEQFLF